MKRKKFILLLTKWFTILCMLIPNIFQVFFFLMQRKLKLYIKLTRIKWGFLFQWLKAQGQKANCGAWNNLSMKELKVFIKRSTLKTQEILIHHLAVGLCDIYNKRVYFEIVDNDIFMFLLSKLPSYNRLWSWVLLKMCQGYDCSYLSTSKWYNDQTRAKFYDPFKVFENDIKWRL